MEQVDITGISFDSFISFMFDRPVPKKDPWYWNTEAICVPAELASHYQKLFLGPRFLLERFSKPQLEQAFWAIPGNNLNCSVQNLIWTKDLESIVRQGCVRTMYGLFERLFAIEHLETSAYMWWDALCYDWHCGNRDRANGGDEQYLQDVMFETLAKILELQSVECQTDALHGLGHLHHPRTEELIKRYLANHPNLNPERKKYALAAAHFEVQ